MILIHVSEGGALVWDVDGARRLRELHGLCGSPVGSLPRQPRQNGRLGLPLSLLPEEAQLLAEEGLALLVRAPEPEGKVRRDGGEEEGCLERSHAEQRRLALEERRNALTALDQRIRRGREKKRRIGGDGAVQDPRTEEEEEAPQEAAAPLKELVELDGTFTFPLESSLVQIHTACPRSRGLQPVDWRLPSPHWPHPGLHRHRLRYAVFQDLRARGYYLTTAGKFGGDFLVYPGDPMRFHAHHIAVCVPFSEEVPLQETVTAGRLGSNVKKTVLLCSVAEEGDVVYTSLHWSGMQ